MEIYAYTFLSHSQVVHRRVAHNEKYGLSYFNPPGVSLRIYILYIISINFYGFLWIPMNFNGFLWISMDFYGFLWISMDF